MPSTRPTLLAGALSALAFVAGCGGHGVTNQRTDPPPLAQVAPAVWEKLAGERILFGHQSVGFDLVAGLAEVQKSRPEIRLSIAEVGKDAGDTGPGFIHFRAGKNGDPKSKLDDFAARVEAAVVKPDVAFLKFCFVDAEASTDVAALFDEYRRTAAAIKAAAPGTTVLHVTMPLTTVQSGWRVPIKQLLGRPIDGYAENIKRHEYNERLRGEYRGKEPLFDIAALESTHRDGSRVTFTFGGKTYFALAPELTTDGGHLNEAGRRAAAEALLAELAAIAETR